MIAQFFFSMFKFFDTFIYESRLMHGRLRIAVAELSLQKREKQPESWKLRFPRACCIEEILLVFVWSRCSARNYCRIKFRSKRFSISARLHPSNSGAVDGQKQLSGRRWSVLERPLLQLERRQGQVQHERGGQRECPLWVRLGLPSEVSPVLQRASVRMFFA